jgi:hypothetical protein
MLAAWHQTVPAACCTLLHLASARCRLVDKLASEPLCVPLSQAAQGGAIAAVNSSLSVTDSQMSNNSAAQGGAVFILSSPAMVLRGSRAASNSAGTGGAVAAYFTSVHLEGCSFEYNAAMAQVCAVAAAHLPCCGALWLPWCCHWCTVCRRVAFPAGSSAHAARGGSLLTVLTWQKSSQDG